MELYYATADSLTISIYINGSLANADSPPTVTITRLSDGAAIVTGGVSSFVSTGKYQYPLTTANNSTISKFKAVWSYTIAAVVNTKIDFYETVVGYTTASEVRDYFTSLASKTNDEIYRYEKLARRIINAVTNQTFDFELATTKKVAGRKDNTLELPRRIFTLTQVTVDGDEDISSEVEIKDDKWITPINSVAPGFWIQDVKRGVIDPGFYFRGGPKYWVKGDWGWQDVPEEIELATKLLINDYFCDDSLLRQHGIIQAQFGDRSTIYRSDLWATTGNYDVDILLSGFVDLQLRVI
jgi:hypothetical protein